MASKVVLWSTGFFLALALTGCGTTRTPFAKASSSPTVSRKVTAKAQPSSSLQLDHITMVSVQDGWGLASAGVVTTRDGGRKWRSVNPPEFPVTSTGPMTPNFASVFLSAHEAVIARETTSGIRVWRTTDGGVRWTLGTWNAPKSVIQNNFGGSIQMQFMNAQEGLMVLSSQGNAGSTSDALLQTTDGGIHWHLLPVSSPGSTFEDIGSMTMISSGGGLASINTMVTGRAWVLTTTNGGRSWLSQALPLPHVSIYDQVSEGTPQYQRDRSYWLWLSLFNNRTDKQEWLFEHTTNGGRQWTPVPWNRSVPPPSTLGGSVLWLLPQQTLFLVADSHGTEIWSLTSRSAEWKMVSHLPLVQRNSVSLLSNGDGWVAGNIGSYQTTNGGVTWSKFSPKLVFN